MVRFIIYSLICLGVIKMEIYIPIWLDLLSKRHTKYETRQLNLHSNMVRFIIQREQEIINKAKGFTFQYG